MPSENERELAAFAARNHGVFTRRQAIDEFGITEFQADWRRASGEWIAIHDGVFRLNGASPTWRARLLAATLAAPHPVSVSHRALAAFYDLPGGRADLVEISCRRWKRTTKPGLVVHENTRFTDADIKIVDGSRRPPPRRAGTRFSSCAGPISRPAAARSSTRSSALPAATRPEDTNLRGSVAPCATCSRNFDF